ncbi:MAG: type VI secretion system baseplate subunit TssK [Paracoccaceae bacterium]
MLERKVMWIEGMFLRPHHFQQQDRRTESLISSRVAALQPFYWGFSRIALDPAQLATGTISLLECEGAFPDGVPFSVPGDAASVEPLELDVGTSDIMIWLSVPAVASGSRLGAERPANGAPSEARYVIESSEEADLLDPTAPPELMKMGNQGLRLVAGPRPAQGFVVMPLARVREVTTDRNVVLDDTFIPPILTAEANVGLSRQVGEIARLFSARSEALAGRFSAAGGASVSAQDQFMRLQVCNRWGARLRQMCDMRGGELEGERGACPRIHPAPLHRDLVEAAADLACFTQEETRRPPDFPAYDHDRLTETFAPVLIELKRSLGFLGEQKAVPIELKFHRKQHIYYAQSVDGRLFKDTRFVLVAKSGMLEEDFRTQLPRRTSIGSVDEIIEIIGAAERSVPLRALSAFPADIRPLAGYTAFELDQNAEAWAAISAQQSIAIHPQDVFEGLDMSLWAIRN